MTSYISLISTLKLFKIKFIQEIKYVSTYIYDIYIENIYLKYQQKITHNNQPSQKIKYT